LRSAVACLPHGATKRTIADPGKAATNLGGRQGRSVHDGTDVIVAYLLSAPGGPTGTFADRDGEVPW
jgi:hypothetical protein